MTIATNYTTTSHLHYGGGMVDLYEVRHSPATALGESSPRMLHPDCKPLATPDYRCRILDETAFDALPADAFAK